MRRQPAALPFSPLCVSTFTLHPLESARKGRKEARFEVSEGSAQQVLTFIFTTALDPRPTDRNKFSTPLEYEAHPRTRDPFEIYADGV